MGPTLPRHVAVRANGFWETRLLGLCDGRGFGTIRYVWLFKTRAKCARLPVLARFPQRNFGSLCRFGLTRRDELELLGGARFERGDCRARARGEIRHVDGSTVGKARRWRTGFSARHSVTVAVGFSLRQSPVERERERERERELGFSLVSLSSLGRVSLSRRALTRSLKNTQSLNRPLCVGGPPTVRSRSIRSDPIRSIESPLSSR